MIADKNRCDVSMFDVRRIMELYSEYPLDILHLSTYQVSDHADRRFLNVTTGPGSCESPISQISSRTVSFAENCAADEEKSITRRGKYFFYRLRTNARYLIPRCNVILRLY